VEAIARARDLYIDVGANVGVYSLWAADLGARVIAIEPDPVAASRLRANVQLNPGISVTVVEAAAAEHDGTTTLTTGLDAENRLGGEREVRAARLDSIVEGEPVVAGIKIDVEGAERLVLEGAFRLLGSGAVRALQLEWNSASQELLGEDRTSVATRLREQGFRSSGRTWLGASTRSTREGTAPTSSPSAIASPCTHPSHPHVPAS
jgi:FkbM family methyltransferase